MNDPFKMRFLYGKGMIEMSLNKLNRICKRAISDSGVTKT